MHLVDFNIKHLVLLASSMMLSLLMESMCQNSLDLLLFVRIDYWSSLIFVNSSISFHFAFKDPI